MPHHVCVCIRCRFFPFTHQLAIDLSATCIKGIITFFCVLKHHSTLLLLLLLPWRASLSLVSACVSFGLESRGTKGRGSRTDGTRGFLWWCTVGERRRAASWHGRGGGDDELDVNKLSLPAQHEPPLQTTKTTKTTTWQAWCDKQQPNRRALCCTHRGEAHTAGQTEPRMKTRTYTCSSRWWEVKGGAAKVSCPLPG